jgi:hypothetical protein
MKKILLFIILTTLLISGVNSQGFEWLKSGGGGTQDGATSIATDEFGNVYTLGFYTGTADLDPSSNNEILTSNGLRDLFLQKLDNNGNFIWAKSIGGEGNENSFSINIDLNNNIYIVGYFSDSVDFDPGIDSNIVYSEYISSFVLKLDSNGEFIWVKTIRAVPTSTSSGRCTATTAAIDADLNIYLVGSMAGTVDFDPSSSDSLITSAGVYDGFVLKLDSNGGFLWAHNIGGTNSEGANSISIDNSGNPYIGGTFIGSVDFDFSPNNFTLTSNTTILYVLKLNTNGEFIWVKDFGTSGSGNETISNIITDSLNNIYTCGFFYNTIDFDPGTGIFELTSEGGADIFLQKLDSNGLFVSAIRTGNNANDVARDITINNQNELIMIGGFSGVVDFDPNSGTTNLTAQLGATFIQKLDNSLNNIWAISSLDRGSNYGTKIALDNNENIYAIGNFNDTASFEMIDSTLRIESVGLTDFYTVKLNNCSPTTGVDIVTSCGPYTWINGSTYSSNNNTAKDTLINTTGCDSIITLNLTITPVNVTVTQNGNIISATTNTATYQWLDCDNNNSPISNETNQTFTALENGSYSLEITENSCTDTSSCFQVTNVGIKTMNTSTLISYPNPTTGIITFSETQESITLLDLNGKVIESYYSISQLDLSHITNGIYLLKSKDGFIKKVLIIK